MAVVFIIKCIILFVLIQYQRAEECCFRGAARRLLYNMHSMHNVRDFVAASQLPAYISIRMIRLSICNSSKSHLLWQIDTLV